MKTETISLKENKIHGSAAFPCAYYWADSRNYGPDEPFQCKHHWHDEVEILYFEKGYYQLEINMKKYEITERCLCFIGSGELHAIHCPENFAEKALVFSPSMLSFLTNDPVQQTYIQPLCTNELSMPRLLTQDQAGFDEIVQLYLNIIDSFQPNPTESCGRPDSQLISATIAGQLRIKANLLSILAILAEHNLLSADSPAPDHRIEVIKKSLSYMKEHYREKIYISDLAGQVSMNEQYFCRFFKKNIGKSPMEYLNEMRIKQSLRLLRDTDDSVMNISLECGFNNLGNFMRTFKRHIGSTPLQYRKSLRT